MKLKKILIFVLLICLVGAFFLIPGTIVGSQKKWSATALLTHDEILQYTIKNGVYNLNPYGAFVVFVDDKFVSYNMYAFKSEQKFNIDLSSEINMFSKKVIIYHSGGVSSASSGPYEVWPVGSNCEGRKVDLNKPLYFANAIQKYGLCSNYQHNLLTGYKNPSQEEIEKFKTWQSQSIDLKGDDLVAGSSFLELIMNPIKNTWFWLMSLFGV